MATLTFNDQHCVAAPGETVLDTLRRHSLEVPFSCCEGHCQSCLLRCTEGAVPKAAQQGLKPSLQQLNYLLACQCTPAQDMTLMLPTGDSVYSQAWLDSKQQLARDIWCLRLTLADTPCRPGQFFNLRSPQGWLRSYSAATVPTHETCMEFHVRRLPDGRMSNWLIDEFDTDTPIDVSGPHGNCIYTGEAPDQPLLLIGTGTGLAPLYGIIGDALASNHRGPIHLYHGARSSHGLYLEDELKTLAARHANLHYHPCISGTVTQPHVQAGRAADLALAALKDLAGWRVFLCGSPDMVKQTRSRAYLAGASLQNILADSFTLSNP